MAIAPQIQAPSRLSVNRVILYAALLLVAVALLVSVLPAISQNGCTTDDYGICPSQSMSNYCPYGTAPNGQCWSANHAGHGPAGAGE